MFDKVDTESPAYTGLRDIRDTVVPLTQGSVTIRSVLQCLPYGTNSQLILDEDIDIVREPRTKAEYMYVAHTYDTPSADQGPRIGTVEAYTLQDAASKAAGMLPDGYELTEIRE
jgi:hypothetical protein